jgi:uncharacterized RDD family membrane protein YckC
MFCSRCGTEAGSDDQFCRLCGRALTAAPVTAGDPFDAEPSPSEPLPAGGRPGPSWPGRSTTAMAIAAPGLRSTPQGRNITLAAGSCELASIGRRLGGLAIDLALVVMTFFGLGAAVGVSYVISQGIPEDGVIPAADEDMFAIVVWAIAVPLIFLGTWVLNATGGSPGKRMLGLRVVRDNLQAPGIGWGLGRTVIALLSCGAVGLGFLWATWDNQSQTWHDKMAGTYVVLADSLPAKATRQT